MAIFKRLQEFPFVSPLYLLTLFSSRTWCENRLLGAEDIRDEVHVLAAGDDDVVDAAALNNKRKIENEVKLLLVIAKWKQLNLKGSRTK